MMKIIRQHEEMLFVVGDNDGVYKATMEAARNVECSNRIVIVAAGECRNKIKGATVYDHMCFGKYYQDKMKMRDKILIELSDIVIFFTDFTDKNEIKIEHVNQNIDYAHQLNKSVVVRKFSEFYSELQRI